LILILPCNSIEEVSKLLHVLEQATSGIGLYVNEDVAHKHQLSRGNSHYIGS